ncbi:DUF3667 domain-containing protein [Arenimonas sp. MALMAid1274]|uniref:DUF3667 domain-containing protein n=1 Tax=Arenimonas sp. MALMAid1274 TaxID=3411630 RepID=UPI003BA3DC46
MGHLLGQFFASATDLDGRFWRSLRALLFQPGRLSRDYLDGRRKHWMAPTTLFLLANLLYFVLPTGISDFNLPLTDQMHGQPHSALTAGWVEQRIAQRNAEQRQRWARLPEASRPERSPPYLIANYAREYDAESANVGKALIVVHIPFLAVGLWAVYFRQRRYFAEHLVVATHQFTFLLLFLQLVLLPGGYVYDWLGLQGTGVLPLGVAVGTAALIVLHFSFGLRRAYDSPWWLALLVPVPLLVLMLLASVYLYRTLQFVITFALT